MPVCLYSFYVSFFKISFLFYSCRLSLSMDRQPAIKGNIFNKDASKFKMFILPLLYHNKNSFLIGAFSFHFVNCSLIEKHKKY